MLNLKIIKLDNICHLVTTINSSDLKEKEIIKISYNRYASDFDEHLQFLIELKLVKINKNKVSANNVINYFVVINKDKLYEIKLILLEKIVETMYFKEYFSNFKYEDGLYQYKPIIEDRVKYAGIRNILIELDFVYKNNKDEYYINNHLSRFFEKYDEDSKALSLSEFNSRMVKQSIIGMKAEEIVLQYEKNQLKRCPDIVNLIEHVAIKNVHAGYDIKSYFKEEAEKGIIRAKYIEVKAVKKANLNFYWSRNEIEIAQKKPEDYFLYLLPVQKNGIISIKELIEIKNPYEFVLKNDTLWSKKTEIYNIICKDKFDERIRNS